MKKTLFNLSLLALAFSSTMDATPSSPTPRTTPSLTHSVPRSLPSSIPHFGHDIPRPISSVGYGKFDYGHPHFIPAGISPYALKKIEKRIEKKIERKIDNRIERRLSNNIRRSDISLPNINKIVKQYEREIRNGLKYEKEIRQDLRKLREIREMAARNKPFGQQLS